MFSLRAPILAPPPRLSVKVTVKYLFLG